MSDELRDPDLDGRHPGRESAATQPDDNSMHGAPRHLHLWLGPPIIGALLQIITTPAEQRGFLAVFLLPVTSFMALVPTAAGGVLGTLVAGLTRQRTIGGWLVGSILGYLASSQMYPLARHAGPWFQWTLPAAYFLIALPVWVMFRGSPKGPESPKGPAK